MQEIKQQDVVVPGDATLVLSLQSRVCIEQRLHAFWSV